jgi:site-specific recombinase
MVSTVTTSTVTTVTTVAIAGSLALIGIITLLALLVQKELTTATESRFARALSRALNIGIVPLLMSFVLIVAVKVAEALK